MPETKRFDPLSWFASTCFTILAGAIALAVAVHLIRSVWVWVLGGLGVVITLILLTQLILWWHRRQSW